MALFDCKAGTQEDRQSTEGKEQDMGERVKLKLNKMEPRVITLTQNPDINFLTTKQIDEGVEITGESSFELMLGDIFNHPYFKTQQIIIQIIEVRESHDCPDKLFYRVIVKNYDIPK